MKIIELTPTNHQEVIKEILIVLKSSGIVVFPSDTVYGLLADATNPAAVSKLLEFKERRPGQAISVFLANKKMVDDYIITNPNTTNVIKNLLPGPFTVIGASKHQIDPRLEAENKTLGIRIPDYPLILELVSRLGRPITATSANLSGRPAVYSISALEKTLSKNKQKLLDLVIDAGNLPKNKPSTVIDTTTGHILTLRAGEFLPKSANSLISRSEKETERLGQFLATKYLKKTVSKPIVFLLEGPLGAGKTIIAKGLGKALGVKEDITSPTFNICNEYPLPQDSKIPAKKIMFDTESPYQNNSNHKQSTPGKFIHCDFYRLESVEEFKELDIPKMIFCGNVYAFEWSEKIPAEMISAFKSFAEIVLVKIKTGLEKEREIIFGNLA